MRVLIVSDTHGRHTSLDRALKEAGEIDMFIHLGDVEGGEDYIEAVVECEKHMIRGRKKKETAGKWMEKKQQKENRYLKGMPFMK